MRTELRITIDFDEDRRGALRAYAHLIGINERELANTSTRYGVTEFSGAAVPSLFTLLRPAHVEVRSEDDG